MAGGWSAEIKGLDALIRKLSNLQNLETSNILETLEEPAKDIIQEGIAAAGFEKSSQYVTGTRKNKNSISVGLTSESGTFNQWKEAYFHHYGYNLVAWGKRTNKHIVVHVGYFDEVRHMAIEEIGPFLEIRVQQEINKILRK